MDPQVLEIESAAALGWRPIESRWLGRWLLRAADGFTGRANSALPLGPPDRPLPEAVAAVRQWYDRRDLTPTIVIPQPLDGPHGDPLEAYLRAQGWALNPGPAMVMTAPADTVVRHCAAVAGDVELRPEPDAEWLNLYHHKGRKPPPVAARLLTSSPWQVFALARSAPADDPAAPRTASAIGRISVGGGWAGLTAIEVAPAHRRQGLASAVIGTLVRAARARHGIDRVYVQVQEDNAPAIALYRRCGFTPHHRYHYRAAEAAPNGRPRAAEASS